MTYYIFNTRNRQTTHTTEIWDYLFQQKARGYSPSKQVCSLVLRKYEYV